MVPVGQPSVVAGGAGFKCFFGWQARGWDALELCEMWGSRGGRCGGKITDTVGGSVQDRLGCCGVRASRTAHGRRSKARGRCASRPERYCLRPVSVPLMETRDGLTAVEPLQPQRRGERKW